MPDSLDLLIRDARPEDNEALIALELDSPMDLGGGVQARFDRSPDYFADRRLQEHSVMLVAEHEGELVGVVAGAWQRTMLQGEPRRLLYVHHQRIAERYQRRGVGSALGAKLTERVAVEKLEGNYYFIAPGNDKSVRYATRSGSNFWPVRAYEGSVRLDLPSRRVPEPVNVADLPAVVERMNDTHAGKDLFMPYTVESLTARLARAPAYTLSDLRCLRDGRGNVTAVAGVWDAGATLALRFETVDEAGVRVVRAHSVADHGCSPGAEDDLRELLVALAGRAQAAGRNSLDIFGFDPTATAGQAVTDVLGERSEILVGLPADPPPKSSAGAVYLDPIYF